MNNVIVRDYAPADLDGVIALISDAFVGVSLNEAAPATRDLASRIFAHESLAASTRARLAEVDGRIVGLAFAKVHGHTRLPGVWTHRAALAATALKLPFVAGRDLPLFRQQLRVVGSYKELRAAIGMPITDELKLFAVDATCRGLGVGGKLFDDFTDHLAANGSTRFHLYTDTDCTFGFYDSRGMTRDAEITLSLKGRTADRDLGVFLYSGDARSVRRSGGRSAAA